MSAISIDEKRARNTEPNDHVRRKARQVYDLLATAYGTPDWRAHNDPISELILTILSQNTSDINSRRAFSRLRETFTRWEDLLEANESDIALSIKSAGLSNVKAKRIKAILHDVMVRNGSLTLDSLRKLSVAEAKLWLKSLDGVGPKTAACVLLFSLGMPALPVDTHVLRVSRRLGLVNDKMPVEAAHEYLESLYQSAEIYPFHINMIAHGRLICKAKNPKCSRCALYPVCDNPVTLPRCDDDR